MSGYSVSHEGRFKATLIRTQIELFKQVRLFHQYPRVTHEYQPIAHFVIYIFVDSNMRQSHQNLDMSLPGRSLSQFIYRLCGMVSPQESCIVCENVQIFPKKALRKTEQFDETDSPNLLFAEPRCRPTCDRRKMLSFPKYCNKLYLVKPRLVECFQICKNDLKLRLEKKISKISISVVRR